MARIGSATRVGACWHRYRLSLLGGLVLVLAFVLPSFFPQWYVTDTQSVLTVLGRRTRTFGKGETQRLNLLHTALQRARPGMLQRARSRDVSAKMRLFFLSA